jgi:Domain of unknown function (DUF4132)
VSAAALFDRFNQRLKRLLAERERMNAWDDPGALAARVPRPPAEHRERAQFGGHAGIADAARRAGLDPAGGVAPGDRRAARRAAWEVVDRRAPGELVTVAALALLELLDPRPPQTAAQRRAAEALVHELTRWALPWNHDQAAALLPAPQLGCDATAQRLALELAVSATRQAISRAGHSERLLSAMVQAVGTPLPAVSSQRLRAELCVLLPRCPQRSTIAVTAFTPAANWASRKPWTERLHRELTAGPPLADADIRLLAHLPRAAVAQEPPARWQDRCRELAGAGPAATLPGQLLAVAIDALGSGSWNSPVVDDLRLLAGAAWAAAALGDRSTLALVDRLGADLARVARRRQEPLVAACAQVIVAAAADRRTPQDAWTALAVLRQATRRSSTHEQVDDAVRTLLVRTGGIGGSPTFGLDAAGRLAVPVGDATAVLAVERDRVRLRWRGRRGRLITRVPAGAGALPAEEVDALRRLARVATVALTVHEPQGLEWLLRRGHVWEGRVWHRQVLGHPLTGPVARRLLWQVRPGDQRSEVDARRPHDEPTLADGGRTWTAGHPAGPGHAEADGIGWVTVRPAEDGTVVDPAGRPIQLPVAYQVRLWHPAGADGLDAEAWMALGFQQPIAQLHRTTYHPTPAEVASGHRSARFAGHQVSRRTATARLAAQGWALDGRDRLAATLELLDGRMRAVLSLARPEDPTLARSAAITGVVAFEQRSAVGTWAPLPVLEVPPRMFSEVMWDLDQMVRAARDQTAALRQQLALLLPRLRIADRCRLEARDLHVRGDRGTYRISLANAAVYELRQGRHVCIVSSDSGDDVLVPADPELDGERLRLVLSKAFLLAEDARITDQVILSQLPPG